MKHKWEVDDTTVVEFILGAFGKKTILVNGEAIHDLRKLSRKDFSFSLPGERPAVISFRPQFFGQPITELRVDGRMMIETSKESIKCTSCKAIAKPFDRFCGECGQAMPTAEFHVHQKQVKDATGAIKALAALFLIFGVIMFFVTKSQSAEVLAKLEGMNPESTFPTAINGVTYTVAALREQISWEPWGVLIINLILTAVMVVLSIWGKRAPLAAVLVATATYLVVIVGNAIMDPRTIGQGIYLKIIIIALLVKGIKAALALRTADA